MRKLYTHVLLVLVGTFFLASCIGSHNPLEFEDDENEGYDGPAQRDSLEYMKIVDPALGYVPYNRLYEAINYTENLKSGMSNSRLQQAIVWEERGPIFDSLGPSNGNSRAGVNYTSGRIRAVMVDTLNDPTGNTVFVGGVAGGLWRCTNFLAAIPNWQVVNDYFDNLAISSICQDPSKPSVMYFSTGEATSNADATYGKGVWKSTNAGMTWSLLPSSSNFIRTFKIQCDRSGNVYLAARTTGSPASNLNGLSRSTDGGATWDNITPSLVGTGTATATCTDLEITSTGKLLAAFGYTGSIVRAYTTSTPATVTQSTGWTLGTGIRVSGLAAYRMEMATVADTAYAVTVSSANSNVDSCYKSVDGGATWVKQNSVVLPAALGSGQGWYSSTLAINPTNTNDIIAGGLDAYRSTNGGATWAKVTNWVTTAPYVHADHHFIQWMNKNGESRIIIGCDGGIFLTRDDGINWIDRNRNLAIKQFYAAAIHPTAGSPYLLAGAQDNGTHVIKYAGLSPSDEVVGGDGCYVHINQKDPQIQFGSYVYNQYRRSTNGGQTWSSVNLSGTAGLFVNPFDYDDDQNIMYASNGVGIRRWADANTTSTSTTFTMTALTGNATAFKVSPYTANRVFIGASNGRVLRLDNANSVTAATINANVTNITGATFPGGYVNCVNTGTSDNNLVAVMTNYGINNVWVSSDGGANWTAVDGNLPDMPVRWAIFEPGRNDRMILATEAGIFTTDLINSTNTVWTPNNTFPTVRTDMLKIRTSDSTMVAATHGRGLFTAKISSVVLPQVSFLTPTTNVIEKTDGTIGCRNYADYIINIGLATAASNETTVTINSLSGTALLGTDYDFTTNGSFTAPSKTIVFAAGATGSRTVTIRVYDDTEVEDMENFTLNYSVSGSNAIAGIITSHTFNIADNDRHAVTPFQNITLNLGTYNADLTGTSPFNGPKLRHRLQVLYTAAELRNAGLIAGGKLSAMTLRVKIKNSTTPFNGFRISMSHTNVTQLNAAFLGATAIQLVYSGNYSTVVGDNTFAFAAPFVWDGSSNIIVQFCYDNTGGTAAAAADVVEGMATPLGAGVRGSIYSNWTTAAESGCFLAAGFLSDNRVNASFTTTIGTPIATVLNSTGKEFLAPRSDLYYYNSNGEVMARVLNLSDNSFGCTDVVIDRAGTGASQFWNATPANYLMNKTFRILPTSNSTTGKYEVTFYFTKAEKEGWEAATGKSWNDIQIIKVPARISNVTPANAQPDGPGTVQVISGVKRSFGPDFYTLSAIFENGFSGFGFGVAGRMNTILTLSGMLNTNRKDIDLSWTTSAEINSSVFEVEKSYDGVNYRTLGTALASNNKLTPSTYTFTDRENVQINYYRIKMKHTDGYVLYSNVVMIKNDDAPDRLFVSPNPFIDHIAVRFSRTPTGPVTFTFYDIAGKQLMQSRQVGGAPSYNVNTNSLVVKGNYFLRVNYDGKQVGIKVNRK